MIRINTLGRVIAVALALGASAPLAAQEDWQYARGFQPGDEDVRRVGRRGGDHEDSSSEEAEREAERARREEERANEQQQREAERAQREQERAYEQQQREQERAQEQQQRENERAQRWEEQRREQERVDRMQHERALAEQQREAEQQQREQARQYEQQQREAEQQQRHAEIEQRQVQRQLEREQRQAQMEQARQQREAEQQREQQRVEVEQAGREARWAEEQRARDAQQAAEAAQRGEPRDERSGRGGRDRGPEATQELQRLEQERYQVERGGDRDRYQDYREGRGRDRGEQSQPDWRDSNQRYDASGDIRRRWSTNPREVPQPLPGARLSDRERRSLYEQQRHVADRYRQDWQRRIERDERRSWGLRDRRGEQFRYQQRYWQRQRDWHDRWYSFRWDYSRDPYFWTAPTHRYYRGGRWYRVNQYAIDVLQQAIRIGYEEGFYAGQADRADGWRFDYRNNFVYEDASLGYQGWYVSQFEYNYYFREGFRRGYEDGYYRRWRYGRRYERGYAILPNELDVILRFELFR